MKNGVILFFIIWSNLSALAQPNSFAFRNIGINQGLSQSSVTDMAIDHLGFIWFATQDGLNRYDGKEFLIFRKNFDDITTPTGNRLGKIVEGNNNTIWLITSGGKLESFNPNTSKFTTLASLGQESLGPVSCVLPQDNNHLWIGTESKGLYLYNPLNKEFQHFSKTSNTPLSLTSNNIQNVFRSSKKELWILTNKGLTLITEHYSPGQSFLYETFDDSSGISCSSIDEDLQHNLWLGTFGKGIYLKNENSASFEPFRGFGVGEQLPDNLVIETVKAGRNGMIWVGTYGDGLYIINPVSKTIQHLIADKKDPFSLSYNDVLCIKEDQHQGIWLGTDGGGVSHYDKRLNNFYLLSKTNVPQNISIEQVRAVTTDQEGGLWVGTSNSGLSYISIPQNNFQTFHLPLYRKDISNPNRIVSLLADAENDLWIGTQGNGLFVMDIKTKTIKKRFYPGATGNLDVPDHTFWCILPASPGSVWVGTRNQGLLLINKQEGVIKKYNQETDQHDQRLLQNNVRSLCFINENTLCIGFEKNGVQLLNTKSGAVSLLPDTTWKKIFYGNTVLKTVSFHDNYLWIGTQGEGIIAYNMKDNKIYSITDKQGLPNNTVYAILPDELGSLWLSTNKGLCRFIVPGDITKINRSNFSLFTAEDGLQSNEFNTGAYHTASDGKLFFGGINGLNIFHPAKMINQDQPIKVVLTSANVNNETLQEDSSITYKKALKFPYNKNSLSFNFAALDYISTARLNYYYQLVGYDKNWVEAGNRNYAAYTNLPAGKYLFQVKASLSGLQKNDPVTTLRIIITPPFWKTWWFVTLCVLLITGLLYALYRYRIGQLLRLQKIRNRIATDLHDDIGSTLTNISILSELSLKNMDDKEKAAVFLGRISEEVSHSSQALDDIVWSINTKNDTLEETVVRMRRYAAEIFDAANINYALQLDEQFANRKLNMEQRRDCFLVFKETINNIYKHAQAKNVLIKLWLQNNSLFLEIKDDGIGFDTNIFTHRNGIKNIHNRMEKWDGDVSIKSSAGNGTQIKVRFPVD